MSREIPTYYVKIITETDADSLGFEINKYLKERTNRWYLHDIKITHVPEYDYIPPKDMIDEDPEEYHKHYHAEYIATLIFKSMEI